MKRKRRLRKLPIFIIVFVFIIITAFCFNIFNPKINRVEVAKELQLPDFIMQDFIHKHTTARTETELTDIKNIVIHYVGNPNTSAKANRDYFDKEDTTVSSHFIVGLNGEIIQCLPLYERSAASNHRNRDTISIENCHPDKSGKFSNATYNSLVKLTAFLCYKLELTENDLIRHYDVTGKICPKYYVDNVDEWDNFKKDVGKEIDDYRKEKENN